MSAAIVSCTEVAFTIRIEIPDRSSMLESEETIQEHLNQAGVLATAEALQRFDTDGSPIVVAEHCQHGQLRNFYPCRDRNRESFGKVRLGCMNA